MTASSTQGVGKGSVGANSKGSERMSMAVEKLIGPRIVACGEVTCATNVATITFPVPLPGGYASYVIHLTTVDSAVNASECTVTARTDASSNFVSFEIAATDAAQVVMWTVIKRA